MNAVFDITFGGIEVTPTSFTDDSSTVPRIDGADLDWFITQMFDEEREGRRSVRRSLGRAAGELISPFATP